MSSKKDYCINRKCGPMIQTGFQEQYWVCKTCKLEVTDKLAERVNNDDDESPYGFIEKWSDQIGEALAAQATQDMQALYEKLVRDGVLL